MENQQLDIVEHEDMMGEFNTSQSQLATIEDDWAGPIQNLLEEEDYYGDEQWPEQTDSDTGFEDEPYCKEIDPEPPDNTWITGNQSRRNP